MFWVNKEKNRIMFDDREFQEDLNYLPLLVEALTSMDNKESIHFGIDLAKTPVVFVFYIAKVIKEAGVDVQMYFSEDSKELRAGLESVQLEYRNIEDFPSE